MGVDAVLLVGVTIKIKLNATFSWVFAAKKTELIRAEAKCHIGIAIITYIDYKVLLEQYQTVLMYVLGQLSVKYRFDNLYI